MTKVLVASKNPVKIKSTELGFQDSLGAVNTFQVEGLSAPSGVSDQPMTDKETLQGAVNRVQHLREHNPGADFYVGIEGGVDYVDSELVAFAWVVIEGQGLQGRSKSGHFFLPPEIKRLVEGGDELGVADDKVFGQTNSKQKGGSVGMLTHGVIDRTALYRHAVNLALIPFLNTELYNPDQR